MSESFHAYLKSKQREDETLGETAERLSNDFSLCEWATEGWEGGDDADREDVAEVLRERLRGTRRRTPDVIADTNYVGALVERDPSAHLSRVRAY